MTIITGITLTAKSPYGRKKTNNALNSQKILIESRNTSKKEKKMNIFYEKADPAILQECQTFVKSNCLDKANYYTYREALMLYVKLSQSLIDSQKDFNDAIQKETNKIIKLNEEFEKEIAILKFNHAKYTLVLDVAAHKVLEKLETIEKNNRQK